MIYLVFSFKNKDTYKNLNVENFLPQLQTYLPAAYKKSQMTIWTSSNNKFVCVSWNNFNVEYESCKSYSRQPMISHPVKGKLINSGYTHKDLLNADNINTFPKVFDYIKINQPVSVSLKESTAPRIKLSNSLGGISTYSWISADESVSVSWNTQPPAFPLFVGKNRDDFCVVGNRPLLVAMASYLSTEQRTFNKSYLSSYIVSGYAQDGQTIYENVRMMPANTSITCESGKWRYTDSPLSGPDLIPQVTPLSDKSAILADALIKACDPLHDFESSIFWMSGGKDSRTLASIVSALKIKTQGISYGLRESDYAKLVAEKCGSEYRVHKTHVLTNPIDAARVSNKDTEGLGIAAAHQYNLYYTSLAPELPILHGHGHLLRGGFARTMSTDVDLLLKKSFIGNFTTEQANTKVLSDLKRWEKTRDFSGDLRDKLYWANHDLRLGAYTAPNILDLSGKSLVVFPLLDEKVVRIASGLSMFDKIYERVLFGAIKQLSPELSELPLFSDQWRFDRSPEKTDFVDSNHNFQEGYIKRMTRLLSTVSEKRDDFIRDSNVRNADSMKIRNEFIISSSIYKELTDILQPDVISLIKSRAQGSTDPEKLVSSLDKNGKFELNALLNRVFIAATLYDLDWI